MLKYIDHHEDDDEDDNTTTTTIVSPLPAQTHHHYSSSSSTTTTNNKKKGVAEEEKEVKVVHWLAILDDDTFSPSLHALSTTVATYDHTSPQYLGQLTESASLLSQGILGAFGGAGIFLSLPLALQVAPHLDSCSSSSSSSTRNAAVVTGGDMLIMNCVHAHSAARLQRVEGLWQVDLVGDTAGFYESGLGFGAKGKKTTRRGVLSLHHWKSWHWNPVVDMAGITRVYGGGCFLERFVFLRGGASPSFSFAREEEEEKVVAAAVANNGYSINF